MHWFSGVVLFVIVWWVCLFAVLPIGTRPQQNADDTSGWRGAPQAPLIWRKVMWTTVVAIVVWLGCYAVISSDYLSFRHGVLALPPVD